MALTGTPVIRVNIEKMKNRSIDHCVVLAG